MSRQKNVNNKLPGHLFVRFIGHIMNIISDKKSELYLTIKIEKTEKNHYCECKSVE